MTSKMRQSPGQSLWAPLLTLGSTLLSTENLAFGQIVPVKDIVLACSDSMYYNTAIYQCQNCGENAIKNQTTGKSSLRAQRCRPFIAPVSHQQAIKSFNPSDTTISVFKAFHATALPDTSRLQSRPSCLTSTARSVTQQLFRRQIATRPHVCNATRMIPTCRAD